MGETTGGTLRWDIFCRVIDNFGDVGVAWRLARQLAAAGDQVRLVLDDARALEWMAPPPRPTVKVLPWPGPADAAEVVIEAFGCDPPPAYVAAMREQDPVWINLEYLSAEDYVERSHGLPSPRADGLRKWFYYPGFTALTGGLQREPGLLAERDAFDAAGWLRGRGWAPRAGERIVVHFGYCNPVLPALLRDLAREPTLLLLAGGATPAQLGIETLPPSLRVTSLPWLTQDEFDRLLWASELNLVRGEDSLVRALWAGVPFLWQAYPQQDGAHAAKVRALARRLALPEPAQTLLEAWNGAGRWPGLAATQSGGWAEWAAAIRAARSTLSEQTDLATQLRAFACARLSRGAPARPPTRGSIASLGHGRRRKSPPG